MTTEVIAYAPRTVELTDGSRIELSQDQAQKVGLVLSNASTYTPEQAAFVLGVSRPMVVRWIKSGLLEDIPVGTHHRLPVESVLALRQSRVSAGEFAAALVEQSATDPRVAESLADIRARAAAKIARRDATGE
jgi:excisionase family DNA binding protein